MKFILIKSIAIVFFSLFLMLSSCAKKSSSNANRAGSAPRGDAAAVPTATNLGLNKCADGSNSAGQIFDDQAGANFRNSWVDFFSATMAADQLGNLDGDVNSNETGVNIEIKMKVVNNQLDLSQTKLEIAVHDSLVNTINKDTNETIQVIKINFTSAESGSLSNVTNGGGNFTLTFADPYGKITVSGTFNQSTATGTVNFANSKHYNNEAARSGTLGKFSVNSCGLFQ